VARQCLAAALMALRVVGYEGHGAHRRPIYVDEGPASARLADTVGPGKSSLISGMPDREVFVASPEPAGRIERRHVAAVQRDLNRSARTCPHGIYGAMRCYVCDPLVPTVTPPEPEEEPAMAIDPPPVDETPAPEPEARPEPLEDTLAILADAARIAQEAWGQLERAQTNWAGARAALESSWLATWLAFHGDPLPLEPEAVAPPASTESSADIPEIIPGDSVGAANFDAAVQRAFEGSGVEVRTSFTPTDGPADDAPEVVTRRAEASMAVRPAGGGPGRPATKQDRILAAVVPHRGDLKAIADAVGSTRDNVNATLHNAGKRGRLTIAMRDVLPASFAKYTGV
jgi:hypothetical protein